MWFLVHHAASAMPQPLLPALRSAVDTFSTRCVGCATSSAAGHTANCTRKNCEQRRRFQLGRMLQWLLATDSATKHMPAAGDATVVIGNAMLKLHADMLQEVCLPQPRC